MHSGPSGLMVNYQRPAGASGMQMMVTPESMAAAREQDGKAGESLRLPLPGPGAICSLQPSLPFGPTQTGTTRSRLGKPTWAQLPPS